MPTDRTVSPVREISRRLLHLAMRRPATRAQRLDASLLTLVHGTNDRVADLLAHDRWCLPTPDCEAGLELRELIHGPEGPWGEAPVREVMDIAWIALGLARDELRAFGSVLEQADPSSFALDVLYRGMLESASLVNWLLDMRLGARRRVARGIVYRLSGARHVESALKNFQIGPIERQEEYGELTPQVVEFADRLGFSDLDTDPRRLRCEGETYPNYLDRSHALVRHYSSTPHTPYQVYSGVLHAELWGLWRGYRQVAGEHPHERFEPIRHDLAIHTTTQGALGAMIISAARAASYLGATSITESLDAWAAILDVRIVELRPSQT